MKKELLLILALILSSAELLAEIDFEELVKAKQKAGNQIFNTQSEKAFREKLEREKREIRLYAEQRRQEREANKRSIEFPTIDLNSGGTKTCKKMLGSLLEDEPLPAGTVIQVDGIACPPGWY